MHPMRHSACAPDPCSSPRRDDDIPQSRTVAVHGVAAGDSQVHVVILASGQFAIEYADRLEYRRAGTSPSRACRYSCVEGACDRRPVPAERTKSGSGVPSFLDHSIMPGHERAFRAHTEAIRVQFAGRPAANGHRRRGRPGILRGFRGCRYCARRTGPPFDWRTHSTARKACGHAGRIVRVNRRQRR